MGGDPALVSDERDRQPSCRAGEARADRTAADDDEIMARRVYNRASIPVAN